MSLGIAGFAMAAYGLVAAIVQGSVVWYSYFVIGGSLFLGLINYLLGRESLFSYLRNNKIRVLKTYILYVLGAIVIEFIGRFLLNLWYYPAFSVTEELIHVFLIGYPFAFFFLFESFVLARHFIMSFWPAFTFVAIISAFAHEVPNLYAFEWVYTVPYVTLAIFQINIVILIGWFVLVAVPIFVDKYLED